VPSVQLPPTNPPWKKQPKARAPAQQSSTVSAEQPVPTRLPSAQVTLQPGPAAEKKVGTVLVEEGAGAGVVGAGLSAAAAPAIESIQIPAQRYSRIVFMAIS